MVHIVVIKQGVLKMQTQTYEGYFERGKFYSTGQLISIPEQRKVYITVFDEPVQTSTTKENWLSELHRLLDESGDEKLSMEDFPRMELWREPIIISDEG